MLPVRCRHSTREGAAHASRKMLLSFSPHCIQGKVRRSFVFRCTYIRRDATDRSSPLHSSSSTSRLQEPFVASCSPFPPLVALLGQKSLLYVGFFVLSFRLPRRKLTMGEVSFFFLSFLSPFSSPPAQALIEFTFSSPSQCREKEPGLGFGSGCNQPAPPPPTQLFIPFSVPTFPLSWNREAASSARRPNSGRA